VSLYAILDTGLLAQHGHHLTDAVQACADLHWVQIRHKGAFDRDFAVELEACARIRTDLILNDRADFAAQAKLGLSTHNAAQLAAGARDPIDYLALGPIFPTTSKANLDPVVGLETLRSLRPLSVLPLVAIGGITLDNAPQVLAAGADFVAILSALWRPPYTLKAFRENIERWQQTLATPL